MKHCCDISYELMTEIYSKNFAFCSLSVVLLYYCIGNYFVGNNFCKFYMSIKKPKMGEAYFGLICKSGASWASSCTIGVLF